MFNDILMEFVDREWVAPGECVTTNLWFLVPAYQSGRLHDGFQFAVHEGAKLVARGRVTRVLNESIQKAAV